MIIIIMGVCGCGKTTVGGTLAHRLGIPFIEGDDLHPQANRDKMASSQPLTDDDRWPWLDAIVDKLKHHRQRNDDVVVSCSALKRAYRDRLRCAGPDTAFIHLTGSKAVLRSRLDARRDHFMPPGLLDSQYAALEPPEREENVLTVDTTNNQETIVNCILENLRRPQSTPS